MAKFNHFDSMKKFILLSAIVIFVSCSNHAQTPLESKLEALFQDKFSPDEPGGSILLKKGEEIIFLRNYGLADLQTKERITENTIFNTGSISKTFVSNGILILQEEAKLSVEDRLSKHFNDFENEQIAKKVKIKHLLSHSSGLPDLRKVRQNPKFYLTAKDAENFEPLKKTGKLNFEPGSKFQYSNPAYNGLALIIEQTSSQKWQDFIKERIFKPAGMVNSTITDGPHPKSGVAHAYVLDNNKYIENDYGEVPTFAASGNGGIWSSVLELAKYEKAIQENLFINEETNKEARTVLSFDNWSDQGPPFIGYSWFIGEKNLFGPDSNLGVNIIYHTGSQGGFRAIFLTIPEKEIFFVALFNRPVEGFNNLVKKTINLLHENDWLD